MGLGFYTGGDWPSELLTPREWAKAAGLEILDPSGWRGPGAPDFDAPCTLADFHERIWSCTVRRLPW